MAEQSPIRWYEHVAAAIYVGVAVSLLLVAGLLERERASFLLCVGTFAVGLLIYGIASLSSNRRQ